MRHERQDNGRDNDLGHEPRGASQGGAQRAMAADTERSAPAVNTSKFTGD